MLVRRARGVLLRLVRRPPSAIAVGTLLAAPGAWIEFGGQTFAWWIDGLGLILVATGVALVWAGMTGVRPDWIE